MKTIFYRALNAEDKGAMLLDAIRAPGMADRQRVFKIDPESFATVPGSPFAYWVGDAVRDLFVRLQPLEASGRIARRTNGTTDDNRWIRASWEVPLGALRARRRWVAHVKGGEYSPYYSDPHLVIDWDDEYSSYPGYLGTTHRPDVRPASLQYFFRPGLTWPRRTNGLSFRVMPAGCIFGDKGPAVFIEGDPPEGLLALCAIANSAAFRGLISLQLARTELAQSYEAGLVQQTPVPTLLPSEQASLANLARRAWSIRRSLDTCSETSHAFVLPALLQVEGKTLRQRTDAWLERVRVSMVELATTQTEIDELCFDLYGIDAPDRRALSEGFSSANRADDAGSDCEAASDIDEAEVTPPDVATLAVELVSWTAGVAFGRFDVRLATRMRALPVEPNPFEALPVCSPGMLVGENGLPFIVAPQDYPLRLPEDGLMVDDTGHTRDLTAAVREVFDLVFGDSADGCWREATDLLDPKERNLRNWLTRGLFDYHLRRHSKSRRRAPVIWQIATPSLSYSVWLSIHRLTTDSFFQVQNDLLTPKLAHEERKYTAVLQAAGPNPTGGQRKEIAAQESVVEDLHAMLDEVKRIAPLWKPNLNDGVVLTMAPLWRLVPHNKPWQKELKEAWHALSVGEYDWSHLAMHLWPERVVPKCAVDRSLSITHGLDDVFWMKGDDGTWKPRPIPLHQVEQLVSERTSPAIKAALKNMLEATATITSAISRGRRSARAVKDGRSA